MAQTNHSLIPTLVRLFRPLTLFWFFFPLSVITIISSSVAPSVYRWAAGKWISHERDLHLLFIVAGAAVLTRIMSWASFEMTAMWSAQVHFKRMLQGLMRTRITFFDQYPSGAILSRFIKDFDELRSSALIFVGDLANASIEVISVAGVAIYAAPHPEIAAPLVIGMLIPLFSWFIRVQTYRARMLGHLKGLGAAAMGELLSRQTDLIEGRSVFVFFNKSQRLLDRFEKAVKDYAYSQVLVFHTETWASFWLRTSGETFAFALLCGLVWGRHRGMVDDTLSGVLISALFGFTGSMGWLDFASSTVSKSAPHVRRVLEFQDLATEEEEEFLVPENQVEPYSDRISKVDLLEKGYIEFKDFSFRYRRETGAVLKNLNLKIKLGSKVAIIGRSGSGKSSLLQALMRMGIVESGGIYWDGESVYQMPISQYRSRFAVVPQTPYLFAGTVAENLGVMSVGLLSQAFDPGAAITKVGLNLALESKIEEGGKNLSIGERQLLCLARAIYLQKPVVLMDEPTSALDPITDAKIQKILKTEFKDKTLITIAHRLESLKFYDRVIELKEGVLV